MPEYLKQARERTTEDRSAVEKAVREILADVRNRGENAARELARSLDGNHGDIVLSRDAIEAAASRVPSELADDLEFAYRQVYTFAEKQRESMRAFEAELEPGVILGQRLIPCRRAGCYVPGGRYAYIASAMMSTATARAAGVETVVVATPPREDGIDPAIAYVLRKSRVDAVLSIGGAQAIAAMAFGLFTGTPADIIVGPGNAYVTEAKRALFGEVGIDLLAGPTESLVIADATADPLMVAVDLVSQAEHGVDSPVRLVTTDRSLGERVADLLPRVAGALPNAEVALESWERGGEIILCDSPEEMVRVADDVAPEHLQVLAEDLDWYLERLSCYGSLFLGEGTTVTYGDKSSGTNHILPTRRAARYTGGLSVGKFIKTVTYQKVSREANRRIGAVSSRISRREGMEGHARAADYRLRKFFPDDSFSFEVYDQPNIEKRAQR